MPRGGARKGAGRKKTRGAAARKASRNRARRAKTQVKSRKQQDVLGRDIKKARLKFRGRKIESISNVQSLRARPQIGQVIPGGRVTTFGRAPFNLMAAPGVGQPLSPQDILGSSTAIRHWSYDNKTNLLEIEFTSGHVYQYKTVPQRIWDALKKADSAGRMFHFLVYGRWSGPEGSMTYTPRYPEVRLR